MKKILDIKIIITIIISVAITTVAIKAGDNFLGKKEGGFEADKLCPDEMVHVSSPLGGFCIDMYEASPSKACAYVNPANVSDTRMNLSNPECLADSKKSAKPWRFITQDQAKLACAKAGKRLATNNEWLQAALGTADPNQNWTSDDCQVNNNWPEQPGLTGSAIKCVSSAGAFDMVGNVWEWVEGASEEGLWEGKALPEQGFIDSLDGSSLPGLTNPDTPNNDYNNDYFWLKKIGLRGIVRGGYWNNQSDAGQYAVYMVAPPTSAEAGIGFRCVK
jgi:formylglycine-generating enzyme required for sulfatase activity